MKRHILLKILNKKNFGIFIISLLASLGCGLTTVNQKSSSDSYYYSDGIKVQLNPSRKYIAVRFKAGKSFHISSRFPLFIVPHDKIELTKNRLVLFYLNENIAEADILKIQNGLNNDQNINMVARVFDSGRNSMIITDEFIAQFHPGISEAVISKLNQSFNVGIIEKVNWSENTYILQTRSGDALETANQYHTCKEVIYAHPNFVRILNK